MAYEAELEPARDENVAVWGTCAAEASAFVVRELASAEEEQHGYRWLHSCLPHNLASNCDQSPLLLHRLARILRLGRLAVVVPPLLPLLISPRPFSDVVVLECSQNAVVD